MARNSPLRKIWSGDLRNKGFFSLPLYAPRDPDYDDLVWFIGTDHSGPSTKMHIVKEQTEGVVPFLRGSLYRVPNSRCTQPQTRELNSVIACCKLKKKR